MDARDFEKLREVFEKRWNDAWFASLPKARRLSNGAINRLEKRLEKKYGNITDLKNVSKNKSNKA